MDETATSRRPTVALDTLLLAAGAVLGATAVFGASLTLGLDEFARYVVGVNLGPMLFPLLLWGSAGLLAERSSRPEQASEALRDDLASELLTGVARRALYVIGGSIAVLPFLSPSLRAVVPLGLGVAAVQAATAGLRVMLVAENRTSTALFGDAVLRSMIVVCVGLPMSVWKSDAWVLLVVHVLGGLVGVVHLLRSGAFTLRLVARSERQIPGGVSLALVADVSMRSLRRADAVVLGVLGFTAGASVLGVAWRVADVFLLPLSAFHTSSVATFSSLRRAGELQWAAFRARWRMAALISVGWAALFAAGLALALPRVDQHAEVLQVKNAAVVIAVLVAGQFVNGLLGPTVEWMTVVGDFRTLAVVSSSAVALHLAGVLVLRHDTVGVAVWGAVVTGLWSLVLLRSARRRAVPR